MKEHREIHPNYISVQNELDNLVAHFDNTGEYLGEPARNAIKLFKVKNETLTVKSFRIPNIINQIVYRFFRKSKAERSYKYAIKLKELGIGTPKPVAYYEFSKFFLFKNSYYICNFLKADLTYRELTFNKTMPNWESILRAFTRFTYKLHENGINFIDHSPGNTLIKHFNDSYDFYLVDLNRMKFGNMNFTTRIKNFRKLTVHQDMVKIMSDEYSKCSGEDFQKIYSLMWNATQEFQESFHRRRRLKNRLLFWRTK